MENTEQTVIRPSRRRRRRKFNGFLIFTIVFVISLLWGTAAFWYYYPSTRQTEVVPAGLLINGEPFGEEHYRTIGESLFLRYDTAVDKLGAVLHHEPETNRVILTTTDKIIEMRTDTLTMYVNYEPVDLDVPAYIDEGTPFISVDYLRPIYKFTAERYDNGVYDLNDGTLSVMVIKSVKDTFMREHPFFRSAKITSVSQNENLYVYEEDNGWYRVRNNLGITGYIDKKHSEFDRLISPEYTPRELFDPPWKPTGEKINLTWDYMSRPKTDMSEYKPMPGLNVISPTWFHVINTDGKVRSDGSLEYVEWAHSQEMQVWALLNNSYDPDITRGFIRDFGKRREVIRQILVQAQLLGIDGVNIDFENIYYEDKDYLTQFVRELAVMLHEQDLTVSMDVTVLSSNPNWSKVFDRPKLVEFVDYMAVMAYDEYWASSPVSGPVSSIPWVRSSLDRILDQIPRQKLLLGIPLYARIWEEIPQDDGKVKVSSKAYSMNGVRNILEAQDTSYSYDSEAMLNYAEYTEDGNTYRVWLEDAHSIEQRIGIMREYELAGIASWRRGFEDESTWETVRNLLESRP